METHFDQCADDEHTEDGGALSHPAEQAAREVLRNVGTDLVAELLRVPQEGKTDDVPGDEEQQRADDAAAEGERCAQCAEDRANRVPEQRVADAGQRTHHADLDALDGLVVDGGAVSALLLHCQGHADDGGGHVRVRVVELQVTLERLDLVFLLGIELLDGRDHCIAPAAVLHTLVVPRALQVLVTVADCTTISDGKVNAVLVLLDVFCHCFHSPSYS